MIHSSAKVQTGTIMQFPQLQCLNLTHEAYHYIVLKVKVHEKEINRAAAIDYFNN